jgi:hypothetical protein
MAAKTREQCRHVAASRADLEDSISRLDRKLLDQSGLQLGRQHLLAVAERNFHVDERERPVLERHEVLALDLEQQIEDLLIQDLPGPNLLLDHVVARPLEFHVLIRLRAMRGF